MNASDVQNNQTPKEIFESSELTHEEKIEALKQREFHARQLAVADDENMAGPKKINLSDILHYLELLNADSQDKGSTPTSWVPEKRL